MKYIYSLLLLAANVPAIALGADNPHNLNYAYFQIGYSNATISVGGSDFDFSGPALSGSFELGKNGFMRIGYTNLEGDLFGTSTVKAKAKEIGFGGAWAVSEKTDFYLLLAFLDQEAASDYDSVSDSGHGLAAGFRGMPSDAVELFGAINYVDIGGGSDTGFVTGVRFAFSEAGGLVLSYETADDSKDIQFGLRFEF